MQGNSPVAWDLNLVILCRGTSVLQYTSPLTSIPGSLYQK